MSNVIDMTIKLIVIETNNSITGLLQLFKKSFMYTMFRGKKK